MSNAKVKIEVLPTYVQTAQGIYNGLINVSDFLESVYYHEEVIEQAVEGIIPEGQTRQMVEKKIRIPAISELVFMVQMNIREFQLLIFGKTMNGVDPESIEGMMRKVQSEFCEIDENGEVRMSVKSNLTIVDALGSEKKEEQKFVPEPILKDPEKKGEFEKALADIMLKKINARYYPIPTKLWWDANIPKNSQCFMVIENLSFNK